MRFQEAIESLLNGHSIRRAVWPTEVHYALDCGDRVSLFHEGDRGRIGPATLDLDDLVMNDWEALPIGHGYVPRSHR